MYCLGVQVCTQQGCALYRGHVGYWDASHSAAGRALIFNVLLDLKKIMNFHNFLHWMREPGG